MLKKKIALIGTNGIPAHYGGFETLVEYLTKHLNTDFELFCYCSKTQKERKLKKYHNTTLIYLPLKANGWQSIMYDSISIFHSYLKYDVLVVLGFSGFFAFPFKFFFKKKKIVFNIGGIEWQKVRGNKAFSKLEIRAKKWFEKLCVNNSDIVVVDNPALHDYVKQTYNIESAIIEYGGDHAVKQPINNEIAAKYDFLQYKYDFSISRAQEDMNIHILLDAYKMIPNRNLVVISNWDSSEYGKSLKVKFKNRYKNILLLDAIYNLEELNIIRGNANVYLHTHSLCGTAPSLVEAMNLGLPIICYDVNTNRATTEERSYYFKTTLELIKIVESTNEEQLARLGNEMKKIAVRKYNWERITDLYRTCINNI